MNIKKIAVFLILFLITFAFSSCSGAGKVQEASSFAMGSVVSVHLTLKDGHGHVVEVEVAPG